MRNETKTSAAMFDQRAFSSIRGRGSRLNFKAWVRFEAVVMRSRVLRATAHRRRAVWLWEIALRETTQPDLHLLGSPSVLPPGSALRTGKRRRVVMSLEKARQLRAEKGLTRAQLVEKYGVCSSQICQILKGDAWPEPAEVA